MKVDDKTLMAMCLSGATQTDIAEALSMTRAQISRRVNNPEFQSVLADYRRKVLDSTLTELTSNAQKSVQTLVQLLECDNPSVRLQAASKILSLSQDYIVQHDVLQEIDRLKAVYEELKYKEQHENITERRVS